MTLRLRAVRMFVAQLVRRFVNMRGPGQELAPKVPALCVWFPVCCSGRRGYFGLQLVKFSIHTMYFLWVAAKRSKDKSQMFCLHAMLITFSAHPCGKENATAWRTVWIF